MAGDFWQSSHFRHWLFAPEYPAQCLAQLPEGRLFTPDQMQVLHVHYAQAIIDLAKALKLRFRVAATACVYFKRFYLLQSMVTECDPELMVPTALVLAAKVEHMHDVNAEAAVKHCASKPFGYRVDEVMEAEYLLLQALTFHLVVFHPFTPLEEFLVGCAAGCGGGGGGDPSAPGGLAVTAWGLLNDSYLTPLTLCHPPYKIALACVVMASVLSNVDISGWIDTLGVEYLQGLEAITSQIGAMSHTKAITPPTKVDTLVDRLHTYVVRWRFRKTDDLAQALDFSGRPLSPTSPLPK
jgi:cyclin C